MCAVFHLHKRPTDQGGHALSWKDDAVRMRMDEGKSWPAIAEALKDNFPDKNLYQAIGKVRIAVRDYKGPKPEQVAPEKRPSTITNTQEFLMKALTKGTTSKELADALGVSERIASAMIGEKKEAGYNVRETRGVWKIENDLIPTENRYSDEWDGNRIVRFGLLGDTHLNSKYAQITHLRKLYDIFAAEGIDTVYHTGDLDDGEQMRKGHQYELYNQGFDDHRDEIIRVYPKRDGMRTRFIIGNHDASLVKLAGADIGRAVASERKDMEYLGPDSAVIQLTDNCTLELRHPGDGTAYAISYKIQKMVEAMSGGEKPNVLAVGHYHKIEYLPYRNIEVFQTGTFCAQTPWMRGRGIAAMMGGWIVELRLNIDGGIERVIQQRFPFATAIKDDWKNWR